MALDVFGGESGFRELELAEDMVPQVDRVGEALEAEPMLGEPGMGYVRATAPSAITSRS